MIFCLEERDENLFKLFSVNFIMEMKILKDDKDDMEIELNSLTLVELLRVYLNKDSAVTFAAWKREHPTMNPVLAVRTKGKSAKKAIADAVNAVTKELDKIAGDFAKMK